MKQLLVPLTVLSMVTRGQTYAGPLGETYANVSSAIATYFSSACIYLVTNRKEQDKMIFSLTSKFISKTSTRPNAVIDFTQYFKIPPTERCYVPLQIIIDDGKNDLQRNSFAKYSDKSTMHGTDQYNGGVWLLFLSNFAEKYVEEYFSTIRTPFDVELIVAWLDKTQVHFKEVYRVIQTFPLRQPYMGNWTREKGLNFPLNPLHYSRRTDLEGHRLKAGFVDEPPIALLNPKTKQLEGYFGKLWNVLADAMNATTELLEVKEFGYYDTETKVWSGLLGKIKHDEIDVGVADFILTRDRFEIMDFSFPLIVSSFQIFFREPGTQVDANALFLPFSRNVWLTIIAWLVVGSIAYFVGCYVADHYFFKRDNKGFQEAFFFVLGALCCQGCIYIPKKVSTRILFLLTFILSGVLIPSYSASLISYLTVSRPIIPFGNFKEFYLTGKYRMTVLKNSYEYSMFTVTTSDPYMSKIYEKDLLPNPNQPTSYKQAIQNLCSDRWSGFFGVQDLMQWALVHSEHFEKTMGSCTVLPMTQDVGKTSIGMAFPKLSHYKGLVNHHVRNLQSIGIMARLKREYWPTFNARNKDLWTPVRIENVYMIFVIFGVGFALAVLIIAFEKFRSRNLPKPPVQFRPEMSKINFLMRPLMEAKITHAFQDYKGGYDLNLNRSNL